MSLEILNSNLMQSKRIIEELAVLSHEAESSKISDEKDFFNTAASAMIKQLEMINNSIPGIISSILPEKKAVKTSPVEMSVEVKIPSGIVMLNREYRKKFIDELRISEDALREIRKKKREKSVMEESDFKKPSEYTVLASRFFSKQAFKMADSGAFKGLQEQLRKANMPHLLSTYLSITIFSTFAVLLTALAISLFLAFFSVSMPMGRLYPTFNFLGTLGLASRLLKNTGISLAAGAATFWFFYIYPSTQAASISTKIRGEMPFVTIHMASIAGSGVEPSRVFQILAVSPEYPAISKEIKKIINYVNLYGYDLVNSLRNVSKTTSNERLGELFNGIATTISGGGSLKDYLNKRAEDTLLDYKLERKKYSNMAETSMDIYIGILVAAPLIFMVMLVVMNVTGMGLGMSMQMLSYLVVAGVALINIVFLMFLQLRQEV
ncbi:MAG: type II secretion system F family protein [archaeon]